MKTIFKPILLLSLFISTINADKLTNIFTSTKNNSNVVSLLKDNHTFNDYLNTHKMPVSLYAIQNHPKYLKDILSFHNDLHKPFGGYSNVLNYAINNNFDLDKLTLIFELSIKNHHFDINQIEPNGLNTLFYLNDKKSLNPLLKKALFYQNTHNNIIINNEDVLERTLKNDCSNYKLYLDLFDLSNFKYLKIILNNNSIQHEFKNIIISDFLNKIFFNYKDINIDELITLLDHNSADTNIHKQIALFYKNIPNHILYKIKNTNILKTYLKFNHFKPSQLDTLLNNLSLKEINNIDEDYNVFNSLNNKTSHLKKNINNFDLKLKINSNLAYQNKLGLTPINFAIKNNLTERSSYILDEIPNINIVDYHYLRSPLHYAVLNNNINLVNKLIKLNLDPNIKDFFNKTPLEYAIIYKNYPIIKTLLKLKSLNVDDIFINGNPLLIHTILNRLETTSLLLIHNTNIDLSVKDKIFNQEALVHSIRNNLENVTKSLLEHNVNTNVIDLNKNTLFDYLIQFKNKPLFLSLKNKNTNFNNKTPNGQLPIFQLIKNKNSLLPNFLELDINIDIKDPILNKTTLWWAIHYDNFDAFKLLLSREPSLLDDQDSIKILFNDFKYFKYSLDKKLLEKNYSKITFHILKNHPSLFKNLSSHFEYSLADKKDILSFVLENNLSSILNNILQNSFIHNRETILSTLKNLPNIDESIAWSLQSKFKLYFYEYPDGSSPLFNYIKNKDYTKVQHILNEFPLSSYYEDDITKIINILHTITDDKIFYFFYDLSSFSSKKELLKHDLLESQILTMVKEISNKTEASLFFEYCFGHNFKKCMQIIIDKNIIDQNNLLNIIKNSHIPHLLDFSLKNNSLFNQTKPLVDFLLDVNNHLSYIDITNHSNILNKITAKDKIILLRKSISNYNIKIFSHLISDKNYFYLKNRIISEILYSNNTNKIIFLKVFFNTFPDFVEGINDNFISISLQNGDIDTTLFLIKNNFDFNKKNKRNIYPITLAMKHHQNKELMNIFFKYPPIDTKVGNTPFLEYLIDNNEYKFIKLLLNGKSKFDFFTPKIINHIIKTNNHYLIKLLTKYNFDFSKNDYLVNSIKLSDTTSFSYIFNSIPLDYLLNKQHTHTFKNRKIKLNFTEKFLISRPNINNSKDILTKLLKNKPIDIDNLFLKFKFIFKNNPSLETLTQIMNSFNDKKSIIINQELIRSSLIENLDFEIYSYLLSHIQSIDEINPYSFNNKNNITYPIAISMNYNARILTLLNNIELELLNKGISNKLNVFTNLIKNNSFKITKELIKKGVNPNIYNLSLAKTINNEASGYILNHKIIDPWWSEILRLINNNFQNIFISFIAIILIAILIYKSTLYLRRKKDERTSLFLNSLKVDYSMDIVNLKKLVLDIEVSKLKGEMPLNRNNFHFYQEYKYYLELLSAIENIEKRAWAKNSHIDLNNFSNSSSNIKITDDDLELLLNEISQGKDAVGLQDSSSNEDIEVLEKTDDDDGDYDDYDDYDDDKNNNKGLK